MSFGDRVMDSRCDPLAEERYSEAMLPKGPCNGRRQGPADRVHDAPGQGHGPHGFGPKQDHGLLEALDWLSKFEDRRVTETKKISRELGMRLTDLRQASQVEWA